MSKLKYRHGSTWVEVTPELIGALDRTSNNTKDMAGIVSAGGDNKNTYWGTDKEGNPGWRTGSKYWRVLIKDTTYLKNFFLSEVTYTGQTDPSYLSFFVASFYNDSLWHCWNSEALFMNADRTFNETGDASWFDCGLGKELANFNALENNSIDNGKIKNAWCDRINAKILSPIYIQSYNRSYSFCLYITKSTKDNMRTDPAWIRPNPLNFHTDTSWYDEYNFKKGALNTAGNAIYGAEFYIDFWWMVD